MSFGFSVGDILLVSQLAYGLYSTVTSGRRSAGKDLKELEDVLFGLRCSLDHLGRAAKDISATTSNRQDTNENNMRQKLDTMINACGATLQELDSVTKRYREAADAGEDDVADDTGDLPAAIMSTNPNKKRSIGRFKKNVRVNWMKIRWDIERTSLSEYRQKLQAHTDAINIVLNTFLWSTTNRIEADGKVNTEKMQDLQNQALKSNTFLLQLVQEIYAMLLVTKCTVSPRPAPPTKPSPQDQGIMEDSEVALEVTNHGVVHDETIHSVRPHYSSFALFATAQRLNSASKHSNPLGPFAMRQEPPSNDRVAAHHSASTHNLAREENTEKLPAAIGLLNERRQSTGSKEFKGYQKKYHPPNPLPKPSFLNLEIPTVRQLHSSLAYIFRPFVTTATHRATANRNERKTEIIRWIQGLDHVLDSWISEPISSSSDSKEAQQTTRNEIVDLLVSLNESIDESDDKVKNVFYQGTEQGGIDKVLDKLQRVSRSVRGMKEIEEFMDVRKEWKDNRYYD